VNISPGMSLSRCHKNASESDLAVVWEDLEMHDAVCAAASGFIATSYVFANLTDVSVSFYPLAMDFVPPRDLNSSAVLEVRVCTKDMISGQPEPVK